MEKNLIFSLGSEEFGIQVLHIREITGMTELTSLPSTPPAQELVNLRGPLYRQVLPVPNLSLTFDFKPRAYTDRTCIVVVSTQPPNAHRPLSTVTDGVAEALNIAAEDIQLSPDFGDGAPIPSFLGMARVSGQVKLLIDPAQSYASDTLLKLSGD